MNKKLIILLALFFIMILPNYYLAAGLFPRPTDNGIESVEAFIDAILNPVWQVFVGIAVISFIVSGGLLLTANGNQDRVKIARVALIAGVAGIIVGIISFSAVSIVSNIFAAP